MSGSNCCFLTCILISQEASQVFWYSHLLKNFPQFVVIHTVKGFGIVNKAKVDIFLELSCFFDHLANVGNLISGSSAFSKSSVNIWSSWFMSCWSLAWRILSITLLACGAAAATSRQSCLILCDPIDGSPPGSPVPGILKRRTLEWVAISFSNTWKWKVKVKSLSRVRPSALLTMPKCSTMWITRNSGKFFNRWEYQTTWPASWEISMQVKKQQLELDMELITSKLGKE